MSLRVYSIVFFFIFIIALTAIAIWSGRKAARAKGGSSEGYYLGGRATPWYVLAFAYVTSSCSAGAFIGDAGVMATMGFPYYWYLIAVAPAMVIPAVFLMRKMRKQADKLGSLSIPEYLGEHYNSPFFRLLVSILLVVCYVFVLVSQFKGSAVLLEQFTGISFNTGLVVISAVVCFFVIIGGLNSVAWTDFAQGIPMLILSAVVLIMVFIRVGGFPGIEAGLMKINPDMVRVVEPEGPNALMTVGGIIGNFVYWFVVFISQPYLCSHFLALPNVNRKTVGKFLLLSLFLALVFNMFCLVGLAGRVLFPNVEADYMSATVVTELLPAPIAAFLMIGFFCAVLTTATAILLTMGQAIGRDIYPRISKNTSPKKEILVTRISAIVISALVVYFNMVNPPKLLSLFMYMGLAGLGSCIGIPLFGAILTNKATKEGALTSGIGGVVVYVAANLICNNYLIACLIAIIVSIILMVAVSALTQKKASADEIALPEKPTVAN